MPYVVGLVFVNQKKPPGVWSGTGTIINPRGLILTANHVLKDEDWKLMAVRNFVGRGPNIFVGNYQLVEGFPEHDLALIYIPNLSLDGLKKPMDWLFADLQYGHPVGSFGYPVPKISQKANRAGRAVDIEITLRFKSYFIAGSNNRPPLSKTYTLDSFTYGGHSGGPVFDREGRLFGVMVQTELRREKGYEISYCTAVALSNIQSELVQAQRQRP